MIIKIDVTDWAQEAEGSSVKVKNMDDIFAVMTETNMKPLQIGRLATVLRETGEADKDILPSNKLNLQIGAAHHISQAIARQRAQVKINGEMHDIRRYIATVTTDETGEDRTLDMELEGGPRNDPTRASVTLVEYDSPEARERIIHYLMTNVMGRISERFTLIAAGKGDVKGVASALKAEIDRVAMKFY